MPILVSRYWSETTPESAEDGEHSDTGESFIDEPHTFRELVRLMREHPEASTWPARGSVREWYGTGYETDYMTGTDREYTIRFSRSNNPRAEKYWRKAAVAAGIVKGAQ